MLHTLMTYRKRVYTELLGSRALQTPGVPPVGAGCSTQPRHQHHELSLMPRHLRADPACSFLAQQRLCCEQSCLHEDCAVISEHAAYRHRLQSMHGGAFHHTVLARLVGVTGMQGES